MMSETMMLSKSLKIENEVVKTKLIYPVQLTEKLDGVPAKYTKVNGEIVIKSRQNVDIVSTQHIVDWLSDKLIEGDSIIGELTIPNTPFKDISGAVRRSENNPELVLNVFDFVPAGMHLEFQDRLETLVQRVGCFTMPNTPVQYIAGVCCYTDEQLLKEIEVFMELNPNAEGVVVREFRGNNSYFEAGKRSKGMLKYKPKPTVDLEVVSFEEAHSKAGEPLGMIGRINALYQGEIIGIGPGKLTHAERKEIFNNVDHYIGMIGEIEYMRDPSYTALRQPTFQRWRTDKTEPSEVE